MKSQLDKHYRPKADYQLLRDLIYEAWEAYSKEQFPEWEQEATGLQLASLLEQRFPPADMVVLERYGLAKSPESVSINIYNPEHQRWDCYASVKLPRPVLCPQGRTHFFVGGNRTGDDQLPAEFEPFFDKVCESRKAYNREVTFKPERVNGSYPTWREIADRLSVAGPHVAASITRRAAGEEG